MQFHQIVFLPYKVMYFHTPAHTHPQTYTQFLIVWNNYKVLSLSDNFYEKAVIWHYVLPTKSNIPVCLTNYLEINIVTWLLVLPQNMNKIRMLIDNHQ